MGVITKYKFNQELYADFIPVFNSSFTDYTITDEIDTDGYTIRTIESDTLPTSMTFGAISQADRTKSLLEVYECNTSNITSMGNMFRWCTSLTLLDTSNFDTSKVTGMNQMFYYCSSLTSLDVSNFDTSQVTNMQQLFFSCSSLTSLDASNFNTEKVTNMMYMFSGCSKLTSLDVSNFNTEKVSNMSYMFEGCSSLTSLDVSNFNTKNVTTMQQMFQRCSSLTSLDASSFNTEKLTNTSYMFDNCPSLTSLDLSNFNTESVTTMQQMFQSCSKLTSLDISSFNTENVTNMNYMFRYCSSLTLLDISNFNTKSATKVSQMLYNCSKLTNVGAIYCDADTINKILDLITANVSIWYLDANLEDLTEKSNITYKEYKVNVLESDEEIVLRSNGEIYDELNLLTGQVIQRIGEDNEILEEEIVRTVELNGEIGLYENGYIHISSNEITPEFEFQPTLTNYYVVSDLKPNTQYTVLFEGNPTLMSLGGTTIENPISKMMITSGEVNNILWFDTSASKIMILEGDLTNRDIEYFTGVKSSQKIEVKLQSNQPLFGKGGRL